MPFSTDLRSYIYIYTIHNCISRLSGITINYICQQWMHMCKQYHFCAHIAFERSVEVVMCGVGLGYSQPQHILIKYTRFWTKQTHFRVGAVRERWCDQCWRRNSTRNDRFIYVECTVEDKPRLYIINNNNGLSSLWLSFYNIHFIDDRLNWSFRRSQFFFFFFNILVYTKTLV